MRRGTLLVAIGLLAVMLPGEVRAQAGAAISGRVTDASTAAPLAGVLVAIEGTSITAFTDSTGVYRITAAPAGPHVLRIERLGYATLRQPVTIPVRGVLGLAFALATSALEQEAIVVTADPVSRARGELGTASVVGREAVANQVTTSLRGVLELVPGITLAPPGVGGAQQIELRAAATTSGATTDLASFGTLVVLDGVPLSNNANLQRPPAGVSFSSTVGGGIDLRRIPASTIDRVEVIRGVPSARYGDLTQGAIVVETRTGAVAPEIVAQLDAQMMNASAVGGIGFGGSHAAAVGVDVTRQQPNPGIRDDESHRLSLQLKHRAELGPAGSSGHAHLVFDTRFDAYQVLDDRPPLPEDITAAGTWTRDRGLRVSERARLRLGSASALELTASLDLNQQRSRWQAMRTSAAMPFTDAVAEGRSTGRFIAGPYLARLEVEGEPRLAYGRLELQHAGELLGATHELRAGIDLRREWNSGPGYQFDMAFPPQISANGIEGFDRPRRYDAVPALAASAFYVDDRVTRTLGSSGLFNLQAGVRFDALHEEGSWFSATRDMTVQPRINVEVSPTGWLRFRSGWGRVAKSPSVGRLHPETRYFDVVNVNWFANDPAERLAVLSTFLRDPTNPDLGFAVADKAELGVEVGSGDWAVALVAFRDRITDGFGSSAEPEWVPRDRYQLSDSAAGSGVPPSILEPAYATDTIPVLITRTRNNVEQTSKGFELTALLPEIRALRTRLQVQAQWIETRDERDAIDFGSSLGFTDFQFLPSRRRIPFWDAPVRFGRRAMATYRLIHHQPELGLVITGTVQHDFFDRVRDSGSADTLAFAGYVTRTGEVVRIPPPGRTQPEYADLRTPRTSALTSRRETPADWLLSLQVRKTLPIAGHVSFWAFNALDRPGYLLESDVHPRPYARTRFGLELVVRPRAWFTRP